MEEGRGLTHTQEWEQERVTEMTMISIISMYENVTIEARETAQPLKALVAREDLSLIPSTLMASCNNL